MGINTCSAFSPAAYPHCFFLAVKAATNTTCPSPLPKEEERRELVENKITLYSLEKAGCYKTTEAMRGHVGR